MSSLDSVVSSQNSRQVGNHPGGSVVGDLEGYVVDVVCALG